MRRGSGPLPAGMNVGLQMGGIESRRGTVGTDFLQIDCTFDKIRGWKFDTPIGKAVLSVSVSRLCQANYERRAHD